MSFVIEVIGLIILCTDLSQLNYFQRLQILENS